MYCNFKNMKKIILIILLLFVAANAFTQISDIEEKFNLPKILKESSGAIFLNGRLISHNDSEGQNALFELDTLSRKVVRTITIDNATNEDWEDIAQDETSIYIADIGNNDGNRTDLKIYKINKNDYLNSENVTAEIINFSYADQTDFTERPQRNEWDAEALIALNTSLVLLTKNWVNGLTKAYRIPKNSGTYSVTPQMTKLPADGMITGATYNPATKKIYSVGYTKLLQPFIFICEDFTDDDIFSGINTRILLSELGFEQTEAITHVEDNRYFVTSESFSIAMVSDKAKLISFSTHDKPLSVEDLSISQINISPNPANDTLIISGGEFVSVEIYDASTTLVYTNNSREINISDWNTGVYFVKINIAEGIYQIKKIIKK